MDRRRSSKGVTKHRSQGSIPAKQSVTKHKRKPHTSQTCLRSMQHMNRTKLIEKRKELKQWLQINSRASKPAKTNLLTAKSVEELASDVQSSNMHYELKQQASNGQQTLSISHVGVTRSFRKELNKLIEQSDVILQVLDARDPDGCRCVALEEQIMAQSTKKIVFVLNKIDLIPQNVASQWIQHLKRIFPTVGFKSTTQEQNQHLGQHHGTGKAKTLNADVYCHSRGAYGADTLMQLLKNYCRNAHIKTAITVGVIGYPNVGKSSVINSLKRSKAVSVSSVSGHTRCLQQVQIDSKVKILDCPGIIFDRSDSDALLLRNCINIEALKDPIQAVQVLLKRCDPEELLRAYKLLQDIRTKIPLDNPSDFLNLIAKLYGKLAKGGVPDRNAAANMILQDWNKGKIRFFVKPPISLTGVDPTESILETTVVSGFNEEFDIEKIAKPTTTYLSPTRQDLEPADITMSATEVESERNVVKDSVMSMQPAATRSDYSDDESDMDACSDTDVHPDALDMIGLQDHQLQRLAQKVTKRLQEDQLNPQNAALNRKKAKAWRKLKRKTTRQRLNIAQEESVCDNFQKLQFQLP